MALTLSLSLFFLSYTGRFLLTFAHVTAALESIALAAHGHVQLDNGEVFMLRLDFAPADSVASPEAVAGEAAQGTTVETV